MNCPFKNFHNSYGIDCINVDEFQLLLWTPDDMIPEAYSSKANQFFFNLNFEGESFRTAINGKNFILPPYPPLTQNKEFEDNAKFCKSGLNCSIMHSDCICTHRVQIDFNETVQFVISAVGQPKGVHQLHLHRQTFHVVKIGYPYYHENTQIINTFNPDIVSDDPTIENTTHTGDCGRKRSKCTTPSWRSGYEY